jgi:hypothetical protein
VPAKLDRRSGGSSQLGPCQRKPGIATRIASRHSAIVAWAEGNGGVVNYSTFFSSWVGVWSAVSLASASR